MHLSRKGESLWQEWDGEAFEPVDPANIIYYTIEHVDLEIEVVRRALASSLQRSGIVDGIGDGFRVISYSFISQGYAGRIDEEETLTVSDATGETFYGDYVEKALPITWVEVSARG